jgi:Ala-tRNA(Pro) deacylase
MDNLYTELIDLLERHGASYRLIDHPPEGRTDLVSVMRGHSPGLAAKCMVVMVKVGKKITRHVLGVVPGDAKVDLHAIRSLLSGTYVAFASPEVAQKLAGSAVGTILPFSFNPALELVVDPGMLTREEMFFNAARLDRSVALKTGDYVRIAQPRMEAIARYGV